MMKNLRASYLTSAPFIAACFAALPSSGFAAHPLISDDTGTQGAGHYQLEFNVERGHDQMGGLESKTAIASTTLTYGVTDAVDIAATLPYESLHDEGHPRQSGIGDTILLLKWRWYEKDGLCLGLKPLLLLPSGDDARGLGNGRPGYGLHALATFVSEKFMLLGNLGYAHNDNRLDARKNLWNISAAALLEVAPATHVVLDMGAYRNVDPNTSMHPAFMLAGVIHGVNDKLDLDAGYKRALNEAETDTTWGMGLTLRW